MEKKRILVLVAHPDDEVLGVGGTIARSVAEGHEVYIHIIRNGVAERHTKTEEDARAKKILVEKEAIKCTGILGVPEQNVSFGNYPFDKDFFNIHEVGGRSVSINIEEVLRRVKPQIVYTHHFGDMNVDHRVVYEATQIAVSPINRYNHHSIERVLSFEIPSSTEQAFQTRESIFTPNVWVDITNYLDTKLKAFSMYSTEQANDLHPRSLEGIRVKAESRGREVNIYAAESFCLLREIY